MKASWLAAVGLLAYGQTFEVATVKPAAPNAVAYAPRGGPGSNDPGQISYRGNSLRELIMAAFGLRRPEQLSGPDWLEKQRFDIVAKIPAGATKDQVDPMLRNLLAERFKMELHHEIRNLPIYELTVAKGGLRLRATSGPATSAAEPRPFKQGDLPQAPAGRWGLVPRACAKSDTPAPCGPAQVLGNAQGMADIAEMVTSLLGRLAVDKTAVKGAYDYTLDFAPGSINIPIAEAGGAPAPEDSYPDFIVAMERQMGIKIDGKTGPADVIVIDHAQRTPTGN
jgi:uncharacterized protein (TIGR03435 family)